MAGINVSLEGALTISRDDGTSSSCDRSGAVAQSFLLGLKESTLRGIGTSAGSEIGQSCFTISSPSAYVSLGFPSSLRARLVYFRALDNSSGPFDVRLTHATATTVVYPQTEFLLMLFDEAEEVSLMEVQGTGSFEWAAVGVLV